MDPEFSEFSLGFAFTHLMCNSWQGHLINAPLLPSLRKEGKLGYDLRLKNRRGFIYCAQFKLARRMIGVNSSEYRQGYPFLPYFRFPLRNKSNHNQDELLLKAETAGALVEYVAPAFVHQQELYQYFQQANPSFGMLRAKPSTVMKNSVASAGVRHQVVYNEHRKHLRRYSEPESFEEPWNWGDIEPDGFSGYSLGDVDANSPTLVERLDQFIEVFADEHGVDGFESDLDTTDIRRVESAQLRARLCLGAELFVYSQETGSSAEE